jgi:hypothetical protein
MLEAGQGGVLADFMRGKDWSLDMSPADKDAMARWKSGALMDKQTESGMPKTMEDLDLRISIVNFIPKDDSHMKAL